MIINGVLFNCSLEEILDELVRQLRINDIQYLQKMKQSGGDIMVCCPYHGFGLEKNPSMGIRMSDGLCHCFTCNITHSLQELISFCFGYTDDMVGAFGWKWLQRNFNSIEVEERQGVKLNLERYQNNREYRGTSGGTDSSVNVDNVTDTSGESDSQYVTEEELDSYRYYHKYWTQRGITDEHIIELFDLGYSPQEKMITFPNLDKDGNCLFVAKRRIDYKYFSYPKDVTKHLYGIYQLYKLTTFPNKVYITESMIDCLLLWQIGLYAVALNGLGNDVQIQELKEMPCRQFVLATDSDDAGMTARKRLKSKIHNKLFTQVILPEGRKDIGECTTDELLHLQEVF